MDTFEKESWYDDSDSSDEDDEEEEVFFVTNITEDWTEDHEFGNDYFERNGIPVPGHITDEGHGNPDVEAGETNTRDIVLNGMESTGTEASKLTRKKKRNRSRRSKNQVPSHKDDKKYKCRYLGCMYKFNRRGKLESHMRSKHEPKHRENRVLDHEDVKKYNCQYPGCNYKFFQKGNLESHVRRKHKPEHLDWLCSVQGCPRSVKGFTHRPRSLLQMHMDIHDGKKLKCKYCDLETVQAGNLRSHIKASREASSKDTEMTGHSFSPNYQNFINH